MTFIHGKDTYISLGGVNLSTFTDTSEVGRKSDVHDVTTYGKSAHVKQGGLLDGTVKMSGTYDNTATTGPRPAITSRLGTTVAFVRRPEGTGSGRPQDSCSVVVAGYTETNPVADMVKWSADLEISDTVDTTAQA